MSGFSKFVVVILILLSILYVKVKFFGDFNFGIFTKKPEVVREVKNSMTPIEDNVKKKVETQKKTAKVEAPVSVYFLTLDENGAPVFKTVTRNTSAKNKLTFAIKELLKGPAFSEKNHGIYSEIPRGTKLLSVDLQGANIIINLSSDFQYGGGTDSVYSRMHQLIKTAKSNTSGQNIYLYLNGKQVDVLGGEGIMVSQPLNENSLDD
ncbi:MAG: GerMN domain-containing protein [Candidatus Gastranaerophilales bacterium]|nr:GerMN domain-containing protein [Candidatus Gastranaerophilales bacterium]